MKLVILDGYTANPGDLSWEWLNELVDEYKIYDKTDKKELINQKAGYSYSGMSCSASFKFLIF